MFLVRCVFFLMCVKFGLCFVGVCLVGLCFGGCTALDLYLSRVRTGVAAMRQDCNYYKLDTTKLGKQKGVKKNKKNKKQDIFFLSILTQCNRCEMAS